jgi:hypothetical protein
MLTVLFVCAVIIYLVNKLLIRGRLANMPDKFMVGMLWTVFLTVGLLVGVVTAGIAGFFVPKSSIHESTQPLYSLESPDGYSYYIIPGNYRNIPKVNYYVEQSNGGFKQGSVDGSDVVIFQEQRTGGVIDTYVDYFTNPVFYFFAASIPYVHYEIRVPIGSIAPGV